MSLTPLNLPVPSRISYLPAARPAPLARILTSAVWPLSQLMEPSPVADLRPRDQPRRLKFIRQVVLVLVCDAALAGSNSNAASRAESIKPRFDMESSNAAPAPAALSRHSTLATGTSRAAPFTPYWSKIRSD